MNAGITRAPRRLAGHAVALALFGLCATPAQALELRKCVGQSGRVLYVDHACPAGTRESWRRAPEPERIDAAMVRQRMADNERWQSAVRSEIAAQLMPQRERGGSGLRVASDGQRCERARSKRARERDQDWMRMTYDRMVRLDQDVRDACR